MFEDAARRAMWGMRVAQLWSRRAAGMAAITRDAHERLDALARYARTHSPLYRDALRGLQSGGVKLAALPVTHKRQLMARFDDWLTDRDVRRRDVERFMADRTRIGERYLGRYVVWKSSGSTGEPGIYLQDDEALAIYDALVAVQLARPDLSARSMAGWFTLGGRAALVAATGDHFASIASWERVCRAAPGLQAAGFSITQPLDQLVADLNAFAPAFLASYSTMLTLLADEQAAGRLRVRPQLVWSGGELMTPSAHASLEQRFGCPVINEYGTSECLSIAFGCSAGWLHVNADWVLLEPVDRHYCPVPPGEPSHTALVTNLANRVQPIIRYDLGDSVVMQAGRCACGNLLPSIRVHGRCDDVLTVVDESGRDVQLLPMALTTVVEEATGRHRFQIVRLGSRCLGLRLDPSEAPQHRDRTFGRAARALHEYLGRQGAPSVQVQLCSEAPLRDAVTGKLSQVVATT